MFADHEGAHGNMGQINGENELLGEKLRVLAVVGRNGEKDQLEDCLDDSRYHLLFADTINQGLEDAERFRPEVVLLDLDLPDLDAQDACLRLKRHDSTAAALLIVLAKSLDEKKVKVVMDAGGDDFLSIPFQSKVELDLRLQCRIRRERKIGAELQRTRQFLENLIDSSANAIVAADMKGEIILFNRGAERLFGYRAEEVVGELHVTHLYPFGVAQEVMEALRCKNLDNDIGHLNTCRKEVVNRFGEIIPIQLTAWIVMDKGREVATAGIFTDLRERLQIERQLSLAQEKLMRTEKQAMIAELAGATAHELNQPLTSVLGYTELAKRRNTGKEEIDRILETILSEATRMAEIVRKLSRVTKYETKSYVGEQRIMDIERSTDPE